MKKKFMMLTYSFIIVFFFLLFQPSKSLCISFKNVFFQPELFRNKSKSKKVIIILDRMLGARQDLEIVQKDSNKLPQLKFMRRKLIKLVFFHFMNKKNFFQLCQTSHTNRFNYYDLAKIECWK